jgi:hypothetical protein
MIQYHDVAEPKNAQKMLNKQKNIEGMPIESRWNGLTTFERLRMILNYPDHFLSLGLVTPYELDRVRGASDTELEYVIDREEQPLFQNINLKQNTVTQILRHQFKAALQAVFM